MENGKYYCNLINKLHREDISYTNLYRMASIVSDPAIYGCICIINDTLDYKLSKDNSVRDKLFIDVRCMIKSIMRKGTWFYMAEMYEVAKTLKTDFTVDESREEVPAREYVNNLFNCLYTFIKGISTSDLPINEIAANIDYENSPMEAMIIVTLSSIDRAVKLADHIIHNMNWMYESYRPKDGFDLRNEITLFTYDDDAGYGYDCVIRQRHVELLRKLSDLKCVTELSLEHINLIIKDE